jgi:hypothetical protein
MNQVVKKECNNFLKGKKKEYVKKIECLIKDIQNIVLCMTFSYQYILLV